MKVQLLNRDENIVAKDACCRGVRKCLYVGKGLILMILVCFSAIIMQSVWKNRHAIQSPVYRLI